MLSSTHCAVCMLNLFFLEYYVIRMACSHRGFFLHKTVIPKYMHVGVYIECVLEENVVECNTNNLVLKRVVFTLHKTMEQQEFPFVIRGESAPHIAYQIFLRLDQNTLAKCRLLII